jgi:hypothetical protein
VDWRFFISQTTAIATGGNGLTFDTQSGIIIYVGQKPVLPAFSTFLPHL